MKIEKKHILIIIGVLMIVCAISAVDAYTGTGFSHDIPLSKYSDISHKNILDKYNDTECEAEVSGICTRVVDGDTIYVDGVGKVRFVGVNTPENGVEGGDVSKYFVQKLCMNQEVGLDIDDSKQQDKYGRTLAVVIIDDKNLNEMLLKEGLAEIMYISPSEFDPYSWSNGSTDINEHAHSKSTDTSSNSSGKYVASMNSDKFHKPSCRWAEKIYEQNKISFNSRESAINNGYQPCKVCNP